jgi:hypothetical protein
VPQIALLAAPFWDRQAALAALTGVTGVQDVWIVFRCGRTPTPPWSYRLSVEEISRA